MNTAAKGRRNEARSIALFEALGYATMRSAASKGVWDFVAYNAIEAVWVQVKSNRAPGSAEMEAMQQEQVPPGCRKLLHIWKDYHRVPVVKEV